MFVVSFHTANKTIVDINTIMFTENTHDEINLILLQELFVIMYNIFIIRKVVNYYYCMVVEEQFFQIHMKSMKALNIRLNRNKNRGQLY